MRRDETMNNIALDLPVILIVDANPEDRASAETICGCPVSLRVTKTGLS